jgi:hypothetical protein
METSCWLWRRASYRQRCARSCSTTGQWCTCCLAPFAPGQRPACSVDRRQSVCPHRCSGELDRRGGHILQLPVHPLTYASIHQVLLLREVGISVLQQSTAPSDRLPRRDLPVRPLLLPTTRVVPGPSARSVPGVPSQHGDRPLQLPAVSPAGVLWGRCPAAVRQSGGHQRGGLHRLQGRHACVGASHDDGESSCVCVFLEPLLRHTCN